MRAVLFDMDGVVVVDSEYYWVERERKDILPVVVPDEDVPVGKITGMNYREIYDYLDAEYDVEISREEYIEIFHETANEIYTEHASLFPEFRALLEELEARNVAIGLVSSSPHEWIDVVLERFSLEGAFDAVVSAEEIDGPGKPEPDVYEYAADRVGVPIDECVE